ncbi:L-threonylcarbamoyladenylate synthase [Pseudemcibacter aquimaris]|uniref:L-threonylcarbamoyladenylate synthase n=1 Tax=Pseudemcibacter aquimaris TaxID=2857064 RepID=UPI002011E95B|nr:L-threonylcarbamoyladenylate synthase [Pseudemcibacter aquimaris]MCC3861322.1 threonylcarbamoyl-AMP synthase [Pseudemcibacter aquimaris]WDU58094.1 threonylcarbamoyl-AMP synthase [Pseudemcibacter aquimaris]
MTNKNRIQKPDSDSIRSAADLLRDGNIVSFPTETVYGLGADAKNGKAVAKIFAAKNRPDFNPLIVHLPDPSAAENYVHMNDVAKKLASAFWPGPFTMVLPLNEESGISDLITAGLDTVAIRVPANEVAHQLLKEFDGPIAAPSANKSGHISPTTANHVDGEFGDELEIIIDGGPCNKGIESTIIQITDHDVVLLRPGSITPEDIKNKTGIDVISSLTPTDNPVAPGQLKSHYAPNAKVRLNATGPNDGEAFLAFGETAHHENMLNLSPTGDLEEAASNLFSMMRELDDLELKTIAVSPIPQNGLGIAINDRLSRAAAPKE